MFAVLFYWLGVVMFPSEWRFKKFIMFFILIIIAFCFYCLFPIVFANENVTVSKIFSQNTTHNHNKT